MVEEGELITDDWLRSKSFKKRQVGSYQLWQRVDEDGLFLDSLVFRKNDIAAFGLLGLDMDEYFKSIMGNDVRIFYRNHLIQIYKLLLNVDI